MAHKKNRIAEKAVELRAALAKLDEATGLKTAWTASSQGEVAQFFGVSVDTVKNWSKQGMPGSTRNWRLDLIAQWLRNDGPWQRWEKDSGDPLLDSGGDSDALERYRLAKAKHAELDFEHRKGELIEREKARDIFSRWAVVIRRMGEKLAKRYGNDAAETVNETLEECAAIVQGGLGSGGD